MISIRNNKYNHRIIQKTRIANNFFYIASHFTWLSSYRTIIEQLNNYLHHRARSRVHILRTAETICSVLLLNAYRYRFHPHVYPPNPPSCVYPSYNPYYIMMNPCYDHLEYFTFHSF